MLIGTLVPTEKDKTKANVLGTRMEERIISELLLNQILRTSGLTNLPNDFILNSLHNTNEHHFFVNRTNAASQVVDIWQTPFKFELIGQTNLIISSAGPNQKFGDKDDIVFISGSNSFVNP